MSKQLRIAIVLYNLRAEGGPALAADLCAEWIKSGYSPHIILMNDDEMAFADRFNEMKVPIDVLGIKSISLANYPRIFLAMARRLKVIAPDALVSVPSGVHGVFFAAAAWMGIKARIVHVGNYPWHWQRGFWKYRVLMRLSAPLTPYLVCVTEHVRSGILRHFGHVAKSVHVIPNGVDTIRFDTARRNAAAGRNNTDPVVLMVGRLDPGKDHETLLRAVQLLLLEGMPVRLLLAGDGPLRSHLEDLASHLQLKEQVEFLGSRSDVARLLGLADVFAFSVEAEEGLGIALVEAMASSLPIVATDVGACREVLDNGRCGILVAPKDIAAWAAALRRICKEPFTSDRLTLEAKVRASRTYSASAMARGYANLAQNR